MPKSDKEEALAALTAQIFSAMLNDIVMDATLQSHHEIKRSRAVCRLCNTNCGSIHTPDHTQASNQTIDPRAPSPSLAEKSANGSGGTGASTPTGKVDGNILFECVNCNRQIASNRYAPHLASCLGIGNARRGAVRSASNLKQKMSTDLARSASPSEIGNASDESRNLKNKGKSKNKRADEAEFNLKRKRLTSPQISPGKKTKKPKTSGSPLNRLKAHHDGTLQAVNPVLPSGSQSMVPSKLRDSSVVSLVDQDKPPSPASRPTTPGTSIASASTPTSSALSVQSPVLPGTDVGKGRAKYGEATGLSPTKQLSPPRPLPPPVRIPEPDYLIDVEGEETGSSTDTDSP